MFWGVYSWSEWADSNDPKSTKNINIPSMKSWFNFYRVFILLDFFMMWKKSFACIGTRGGTYNERGG